MDNVDASQIIEEINVQSALYSAKKPVASATGQCLYCLTNISSGKFCDIDCSTDYEWEQSLKNSRI